VRYHLTVLLLFGFISFPAKGATQEKWIPKAYSLFLATTNPDSEYSKGRRIFVQTLSIYCHEILNRLPTNTPAEDAWVEAESYRQILVTAGPVRRRRFWVDGQQAWQ
jgi:hypothetical protein